MIAGVPSGTKLMPPVEAQPVKMQSSASESNDLKTFGRTVVFEVGKLWAS